MSAVSYTQLDVYKRQEKDDKMVLYLESRFTTVRRLVQMTKEDAKTLVLYQTEDGAVTL